MFTEKHEGQRLSADRNIVYVIFNKCAIEMFSCNSYVVILFLFF